MRNSNQLRWTQNGNKSGKENKNWIHPPESLQKGHVSYIVKFLGCVEVDQPKGFNVVQEAIRKLRFNRQIRKSSEGTKLPKVELNISIDGITVQDTRSKTIIHQFSLFRISYYTDDKVEKQFISFIVKEQDSELQTCFVFLSDKMSEEINVTVGQALELAYKSTANKPNKLSFRARQLDVSKALPIYMAEDLCDLVDATEIKRSVPQMPTGMEKDEECEHHLQRAIVTGTVIPTPEVNQLENLEVYKRIYPGKFPMPKQLIRMHPFALEQDLPEYDADSEDEEWLKNHGRSLNIDVNKFEAIIDKLDKNSNYSVITLSESKSLLNEPEDIVTAVYDYWLSKRLRTQHSLILNVKTEAGSGPANDPYIAFRRRKDKMQTRKNRKNDESSYEKMLKLRKDLEYAHTLFQMIQKRENIKLQLVKLQMEMYQKRFEAKDFSGSLLNEVKRQRRPQLYSSPLTPLTPNQMLSWSPKPKEFRTPTRPYYLDDNPVREKRHYKKRKRNRIQNGFDTSILASSEDEKSESSSPEENPYTFKRQKNCNYLAPINDQQPWDYEIDDIFGNENKRFYATYVNVPNLRSIGFARRRLGRGGRFILDRRGWTLDDVWLSLDYSIKDSGPRTEFMKYKPKTPSISSSDETEDAFYESDDSTTSLKPLIEVENLMYPASYDDRTNIEIDLNNPLKNENTYEILDRIASFVDMNEIQTKDTGGSILERWTKSKKSKSPVQRTASSFNLGPDAETVGCSTFRTVADDYFENTFNFKGHEQFGKVDESPTEKTLSQLMIVQDAGR